MMCDAAATSGTKYGGKKGGKDENGGKKSRPSFWRETTTKLSSLPLACFSAAAADLPNAGRVSGTPL